MVAWLSLLLQRVLANIYKKVMCFLQSFTEMEYKVYKEIVIIQKVRSLMAKQFQKQAWVLSNIN